MRPVYETEQDKYNEAVVAGYITEKYGGRYSPSVGLSSYDGILLTHGRPKALVEIKVRTNASSTYATYMISAAKVDAIITTAKEQGLIPFLIVKFTDGIFMTKLVEGFKRDLGGRYDRGDAQDIEECMYIPMNKFKEL
jgi:hypothetical protein